MTRNKIERDYEIALLFNPDVFRFGTRYWVCQPVKITDRMLPSLGLRNFGRSLYQEPDDSSFDGMEISTYESSYRDSGPETGGYYVEYRETTILVSHIPLMAKMAAKLQRDLARDAEQDGVPADFGQFVYRVARSIGATSIVIRDTSRPDARMYSENVYLPLKLGEGAAHIARTIEEWKASQRKADEITKIETREYEREPVA